MAEFVREEITDKHGNFLLNIVKNYLPPAIDFHLGLPLTDAYTVSRK